MEQPVYVVDDDEAVRDALQWLLEGEGLDCRTYEGAEAFLGAVPSRASGCLVLDVRMPGMDGLSLQRQLREQSPALQIILLTGHGDVDMAVAAMKKGAFDFFQKPFKSAALLPAIKSALAQAALSLAAQQRRDDVAQRMAKLTRRETQVMNRVTEGLANKVIAAELGVCMRTVEVHRHNVMEKLQVRTLSELMNLKNVATYSGHL